MEFCLAQSDNCNDQENVELVCKVNTMPSLVLPTSFLMFYVI